MSITSIVLEDNLNLYLYVKSNGSLKNLILFKTGFANSLTFPLFLGGREKGEGITSCRTFSDPLDFHLNYYL